MALVIVGTNSWVTVAEADAYLDGKYGASAWAALPAGDKAALLITACNWLRRQTGFSIPITSTDPNVKAAQCEAAWFWYQHGEEWDKRAALYASGVRSFTVMSWSEDLSCPGLPQFIKDMVLDFASGAVYKPTATRSY